MCTALLHFFEVAVAGREGQATRFAPARLREAAAADCQGPLPTARPSGGHCMRFPRSGRPSPQAVKAMRHHTRYLGEEREPPLAAKAAQRWSVATGRECRAAQSSTLILLGALPPVTKATWRSARHSHDPRCSSLS